jgi:exonuclease VII small subunit
MDMPDEDKQDKKRSRISVRIGECQVELEGTYDDVKKLMGKELVDFTKGLEETTKPLPSSTEITPKVTPKTPEIAPKEKPAPPPSKPSTTPKTPSQPPRVPTIVKKTEKTGKKKIGWKPLAMALVMICMVLSACLVGVIAVYLPMANSLESQVAEKNTAIAALSSQVASLNSQISSLEDSLAESELNISTLEEGVEILNSQIQGYLNILYLNASMYLFLEEPVSQNASTSTVVFQYQLEYAGYVVVSAQSTSNTTYVQLLYSSYGVNYDHNVTVTTSGTAYFPVLPGEVEIRVGNTDLYTGDMINATASAVYRY